MVELPKPGFVDYVKTAFLYHWNMLFFGTGLAASLISGRPAVGLPLIAAAELGYLAYVCTRPKFKMAVQAQAHKQPQSQPAVSAQVDRIKRMIDGLDRDAIARFQNLKRHCERLQGITTGLHNADGDSISDLQLAQASGINKLLWVYLKLLYTDVALKRFFASIDPEEIKAKIAGTEARLKKLAPGGDATAEKIRRTLADTLATAKLRLDNYDRARGNAEYVDLEGKRIEEKIASITEIAINRQDPGFITTEVDSVTSSMRHTEETISDLHLLPNVDEEEAAPDFLSAPKETA